MQCLRGPNQSHTIQPLPSPDEAATSIWPAAFGKSVPLSRATPRRAPDGSGGATMLPPQSGRPPPLRRSAPRRSWTLAQVVSSAHWMAAHRSAYLDDARLSPPSQPTSRVDRAGDPAAEPPVVGCRVGQRKAAVDARPQVPGCSDAHRLRVGDPAGEPPLVECRGRSSAAARWVREVSREGQRKAAVDARLQAPGCSDAHKLRVGDLAGEPPLVE